MKKILTTLQEKWAEYLLEILVITIGILGAFALNNWNEELNNRKKEQVLLREIHNEFLLNRQQFDSVKKSHFNGYTSSKWLADRMPFETDNHPPKDSIMFHFRRTLNRFTFNPSQSTINSIISSSSINLISNDALRQHLLRWPELVLDYQEEENRMVEDAYGPYLDFLFSQFNMRELMVNGNFEIESMQTDMFENRIRRRMILNGSIVNSIDGEMESVEKLLDDILLLTESN